MNYTQFPYPMLQNPGANQLPAVPCSPQEAPQYVNYYSYMQCVPDYQYFKEIAQKDAKIARLQNKLGRKTLKEEELKQVFQMQGSAYFSIMASNRPVQLTHFVFEQVENITYDLLYGCKAQFLIKVSTQEKPGLIDWDDFLDDKKWLVFLEQVSRTQIKIYGSTKRIALLLRSIANESMTRRFVPYFGGWIKVDDCRYLYHTFHGFRTSAGRGKPELYESKYTALPANAKISAERFLRRLAPILDKQLRSFCIIWMHLSFLQTLLLEQGIQLTKIPVMQAENPVVQMYLRNVLTVSADRTLDMNGFPDSFLRALASCKDQPCVILPPKFGKNAMENERILEEAISSGTITFKKEGSCRLATLPVLISDTGSQITSCGIPVKAGAECFNLLECTEVVANPTCPAEYWSSFLAFTFLHMDELNNLLRKRMEEALTRSIDCVYTMEHIAVLGAMWGAADFIQLFARELSLTDSEILDDGWLDYTISLLEESDAQYAAPDGLADIFLEAAKRAVGRKEFPCCRIGRLLTGLPHGAVYFDDDYVCLDRAVFEQICWVAGCNSTAVKRELAELGYFAGKTVNRHAYETRISLHFQDEKPKIIRVYKFRRELFETLAEPSPFQGV